MIQFYVQKAHHGEGANLILGCHIGEQVQGKVGPSFPGTVSWQSGDDCAELKLKGLRSQRTAPLAAPAYCGVEQI